MGVTKRNSFDFNSLQLQQTHRKCHHRQSSWMIGEPITTRATILPPHAVYNNNSEHKKKQSLPLTVTATIATPNQQQFSQKHQRKSQPHSHTSANPVAIPRGQVNAKNCCSPETNARTTNGESEFKSTTEILNRPETDILSQKHKENKSLNRLAVAGKSGGRHLLKWGSLQLNCRKHMWLSVAIALICLSSSVICQNPLKGSALPLLATTATTLSLATRGSILVAGASTYEPIIKYDIVHREDDGMTVEDIDVNSNEQQLLAYYKKAQKEHEDELRRQRQMQMQMQQQYKHHHQERDIERETLRPALHFDDIIPTVDVISSLSLVEDSSKQKKSTASKRSTTKRSSPTSPVPTSTLSPVVSSAVATSTATPASKAATTTTAKVSTTATPEEKCEPKVLDEIPAEPYYDFADIAEDAARKFAEFLSVRFPTSPPAVITDEIRDEVRRRANSIASSALNEDEHLLAFALAAPSTHTVVVKFKDNVTIPPDQVHNRGFLGSYWRELGHAWNSTEGSQEWGAPFRDCNLLVNRWLWPFRISLVESKFKIVAAAFIAADEDVCNDGLEQIFGRKHGCDRNTTFCLLTENKPAATRDVYTCICRESYYLPNSTLQGFRGDIVEMSEGFDNYSCIPCPAGCSNCDSNGVCLFGEDQEAVSLESLLKVSVGSVLGACILCCLVLSIIVFRQRKCKAIASGMWTVLETILLGIVLLYASVAIHFFPASTERCIIEPWLRELGFITCYGAIILKLYRHLVDFRTRKAHRWVLRDVDLLKYLGTMVFAVACYMAAFTASSLDLLKIANLDSLREVNTNTCQPLNWEYVTQHSEILILIFGLHLAYASRNANTQFRERQFLEITLIIEFVVSSVFYILRYLYLPVMSPSAIFLALFIRSQLTNTIALGLIFVPKLWYQHKQRAHRRHNV